MGFSEWTKQRQKDKKDTGSIGAQKTVPSAVAVVSGTSPVSFGEWTYRNRTQPANSKTAGKGQLGSGFSFADDYVKTRESFEPSQKYFTDRKGKKAEESIAGSSGIKTDSSPAEDRRKTEQSSVPYAQRAGIAQSTAMPYAAGLQAKQGAEMPKSAKTDKEQPSFAQRVGDTISGGLKGSGAAMTNMIGTLYEMGQAGRDKQNQELLEEYASNLEYAQRQLDAALEDVAKDPSMDPGRYPIFLRCER